MKKALITFGAYALSSMLISKALKNKNSLLCKCIDSGAEKLHSLLDNFLKNKSSCHLKNRSKISNKEKEGEVENFLTENANLDKEKDKRNKIIF